MLDGTEIHNAEPCVHDRRNKQDLARAAHTVDVELEHTEAVIVEVAVLVDLVDFKRSRVNVLVEEVRDIVRRVGRAEAVAVCEDFVGVRGRPVVGFHIVVGTDPASHVDRSRIAGFHGEQLLSGIARGFEGDISRVQLGNTAVHGEGVEVHVVAHEVCGDVGTDELHPVVDDVDDREVLLNRRHRDRNGKERDDHRHNAGVTARRHGLELRDLCRGRILVCFLLCRTRRGLCVRLRLLQSGCVVGILRLLCRHRLCAEFLCFFLLCKARRCLFFLCRTLCFEFLLLFVFDTGSFRFRGFFLFLLILRKYGLTGFLCGGTGEPAFDRGIVCRRRTVLQRELCSLLCFLCILLRLLRGFLCCLLFLACRKNAAVDAVEDVQRNRAADEDERQSQPLVGSGQVEHKDGDHVHRADDRYGSGVNASRHGIAEHDAGHNDDHGDGKLHEKFFVVGIRLVGDVLHVGGVAGIRHVGEDEFIEAAERFLYESDRVGVGAEHIRRDPAGKHQRRQDPRDPVQRQRHHDDGDERAPQDHKGCVDHNGIRAGIVQDHELGGVTEEQHHAAYAHEQDERTEHHTDDRVRRRHLPGRRDRHRGQRRRSAQFRLFLLRRVNLLLQRAGLPLLALYLVFGNFIHRIRFP